MGAPSCLHGASVSTSAGGNETGKAHMCVCACVCLHTQVELLLYPVYNSVIQVFLPNAVFEVRVCVYM